MEEWERFSEKLRRKVHTKPEKRKRMIVRHPKSGLNVCWKNKTENMVGTILKLLLYN